MIKTIKQMIEDKKEYKEMMKRVDVMPEDFAFVYKQITQYMWQFAGGSGHDMLKVHYDLIELFEMAVLDGRHIRDVIGDDVAAFADELLENARTYTNDWKEKLNKKINAKLGDK